MKKHGSEKNLSFSLALIFSLTLVLSLSSKSTSADVVAASSFSRYLPLVVSPGSPPGPTTRLVVFEGFYNPT
jgi:hypothetical protein